MGITFNPFTGTLDFTGSIGGGGGGIGGTIAPTQVAFGTGADTIGGTNDFIWDNTNKVLQVIGPSSLPVTTGADFTQLLVTAADDSTYFNLGILNTTVSQDVNDGVTLFQANSGDASLTVHNGAGTLSLLGHLLIPEAFPAGGLEVGGKSLFQNDVHMATNLLVDGIATALSINLQNVVTTNASALNEPTLGVGNLNIKIGTGYTQTTGPTPRAWGFDWAVQGPIAVQPHTINGFVGVVNNYYNGDAADSPIGGMWLTTGTGFGNSIDAIHTAATRYANAVGLGITGTSTGGNTGWTTGIQVGGAGSPWNEASSKIGTGIHARDYTTYGLLIDNPSGSPTASIQADGVIIGATFKPTTSYKSVDGSTGATGTATAVNTLTIKNGLVTNIA